MSCHPPSRRRRDGWEQCKIRLFVNCGAEAVVLRLAWRAEQDEHPDASNDGNEADPVPLAALAHVVKAAPGDGQAWDNEDQDGSPIEDGGEDVGHGAALRVCQGHHHGESQRDEETVERVPPVLGSFGAAVEVGVILKDDFLKGCEHVHS